jgi:hypothetical protein
MAVTGRELDWRLYEDLAAFAFGVHVRLLRKASRSSSERPTWARVARNQWGLFPPAHLLRLLVDRLRPLKLR